MKDFLAFRRMITPLVIQIIFWLGLIGCVLGGIGSIIMSVVSGGGGSNIIIGILMGLGMMVIGPVVVRIYCEVLILFFRMNETLTDIRNNQMSPPQ